MMTSTVVFVLLAVLKQTNGHFDPGPNIAKGGNVIQSSLGWNGVAERAIDGNRASLYGQDSCTHTQNDVKPWWRLDLLKTYKINTVTITNRKDCCPERLNGAEIRIGNSLNDHGNGNPRCAVISSIAAGSSDTFTCNGMEGRYVNIVIPGRKDCCPERLNGAEIHIGNSLNDNGNGNPRCAVISSITAGSSDTFKCNGMEGRYVNIVIPGRQEYLTLCEVEVTGINTDDSTEYVCG
ncbi:fucolectin-4-like [Etheostoma cragini]|uniref:fucolectin-4-like n=1 Tax=Etheostoma cragini TaxID=417921 RepID=UPI00155E10E4|nr:fucolectin-4-like [Etheostoma cragini]